MEVDRLIEPVVFLPGLLCDAQLWQPQVDGLGGGIRPWIADLGQDDSMAGMARRVLAEAPFERFSLCGLSMGGYVALEIMRHAPQRIERLALLDTQAVSETAEARKRRISLIALAENGSFPKVIERLLPLELFPPRLADARLVGIIKSMARNVGLEAYLRQQRAILQRPDSVPTLAGIDCPTLVLCGEHDQLAPRARHDEMAAAIAGAALVVLPECGHMSTLEKPEETNRALAGWLRTDVPAG
ncbi:MAG: alpha/beta fold hydrolase [Burkholderiales bacterium]